MVSGVVSVPQVTCVIMSLVTVPRTVSLASEVTAVTKVREMIQIYLLFIHFYFFCLDFSPVSKTMTMKMTTYITKNIKVEIQLDTFACFVY